jgi:hypothetical protein
MLCLIAKAEPWNRSFWKDALHAAVELSSLFFDIIASGMELCEIKHWRLKSV